MDVYNFSNRMISIKMSIIKRVRNFIEDFLNPKDFYSVMRPFFYLNFFGGLWAYKIVGKIGNRHVEVSYFGLVNTLIHAILFCACHVLRVTSRRSFIGHFFVTKISEITNDIQNISQSAAILVSVTSCFLKRNKFRSILSAITAIDLKFVALGAKLNYKSMIQFAFILMVLKITSSFLLVLGGFILLRSAGIPDILVWIMFFMPHVINSNLKITFVFILRQISNRFRYINYILNQIRQKRERIYQLPMKGSMNEIKIRKLGYNHDFEWSFNGHELRTTLSDLCKLHEELCDACYLIEEYFSHQILTLIAIDFFVFMCCSYYIVDGVYNQRAMINVNFVGFVSFFAYYLTVSFMTVFGLVQSADRVTKEVSARCGYQ